MKVGIFVSFFLLVVTAISAQDRSQDNSCALRPPKGAQVAIVEFEDLQCPDCANARAVLADAAKTYKIPLLRRDFPLPKHAWARPAAVLARYFDTKSKRLGDAFRDAVYANQANVTADNLRAFAEKFAAKNKIKLPANADPKGLLEKKVDADVACAKSINVVHTPTIYVVSNKKQGEPFIEVVDRSKLFEQIESMLPAAKQ